MAVNPLIQPGEQAIIHHYARVNCLQLLLVERYTQPQEACRPSAVAHTFKQIEHLDLIDRATAVDQLIEITPYAIMLTLLLRHYNQHLSILLGQDLAVK